MKYGKMLLNVFSYHQGHDQNRSRKRNASKFEEKRPVFDISGISFIFQVNFLYKERAIRGGVKRPLNDLKFFLASIYIISTQKKKANKILKKVGNMVHPTGAWDVTPVPHKRQKISKLVLVGKAQS